MPFSGTQLLQIKRFPGRGVCCERTGGIIAAPGEFSIT
jgi:hypothetical protein